MVDADALAPNERQGISNHHAAKAQQHGDTGNARQKLCRCAGEIWGDLSTLNYTISQLHLRLLCEFTIGTCPLCKSNNLSDLMTSWRGYMVFKTYHSRWIRERIAGAEDVATLPSNAIRHGPLLNSSHGISRVYRTETVTNYILKTMMVWFFVYRWDWVDDNALK